MKLNCEFNNPLALGTSLNQGAVTGTWLWPNEVSRARLEFRPPSLPANFGTLRL
jgi:hypothetical protein